MVIREVIKAREGATLAIGMVDAGLGRCGQVVTSVCVGNTGPFAAERTFPILNFMIPALIGHGDVMKK